MKKLHLVNLEATDNIITPEQFEEINLASPAVEIFTDFKVHKALMIDGETMAVTALQLMLKTHVRMNIVVAENDDFIGIISTNELSEQHIVAKLSKGIARDKSPRLKAFTKVKKAAICKKDCPKKYRILIFWASKEKLQAKKHGIIDKNA